MGPTLTVEWATPSPGTLPSTIARQALAAWAEARGVRLTEAFDAPVPVIVPDATLADGVESDLEHAHDAITAEDGAAADVALTKAEATLRSHPELPQAAWLRAEVFRARATRLERLAPRDGRGSRLAWARAASLDRGRARGVGEGGTSAGRPVADDGGGSQPLVDAKLEVLGGDRAEVVVALDGIAVHGGTVHAVAGEHQLTLSRADDGALLAASWITLREDDGTTIRQTMPRAAACSREDLAKSHANGDEVGARDVSCSDWVFVEESARGPGELSLAVCHEDACGPLVRWRVGALGPVLGGSRRHETRWPLWATWTLVAATAVVATSATLAATGVFRPTHAEPVFTTGGLHVSSSAPLRLQLGP